MDNQNSIQFIEEKKFEKILNGMPVPVFSINNEQIIGFWNEKCQEITGYTDEEIINKQEALTILFPDNGYRKRVVRMFISNNNNVVQNFEVRISCKNGLKKIISWTKIEKHYEKENSFAWFSGIDITENYETWKALQKSEQKLKESQGIANIGSWDWDVVSNKTTWSEELYRIFGYQAQNKEFDVKQIFKKIINPEDYDFFVNQTRLALHKKTNFTFDYRVILDDQTERTLRVEGDMIVNEKGEVIRVFGTNRDVTNIKQAEIELQKIKKSLERAQKIALIGSWEFDFAKRRTYFSNELYSILDINSTTKPNVLEVLKKAIIPEDVAKFIIFYNDIFEQKKDSKSEFRIAVNQYNKENIKIISASVEIERNKKGEPVIVYGIFQDITILREALKAVRKSEQKVRNILKSSPDAIIVSDIDGIIIDCNTAVSDVFDYYEDELKMMQTKDLFLEKEYPNYLNLIGQIIEGGIPIQNKQFSMVRNNYIEFPAEISAAIIKDSEHKPEAIVIVIKDITEQKIYENKLKDARIKAEESDKLKSSFLANMSHEIRTPMNAIVGFSNILSDPDLTYEEREEYLKYITSSSASLLTLIDDIIDISKIESEQIQIKICKINTKNLLNEVFAFMIEQRHIFKKNNIEVILNDINRNMDFEIAIDGVRLKQILVNLINNSLKFTEKGYIEFGYKKTTKNNQNIIEFYVTDTGIGIKKENHTKIFNRFTKIEVGDSETLYRGTGLGLAISKKLVQLMGGEIWVESVYGFGSTFKFTIPYTETCINNSEISKEIPSNEEFDWQGKTILIAEDEITNYKFLSAVLRKVNAEIIWAKDGIEAVEICNNNNKLDIVLMDIQMPGLDGYEATEKIKKIRPKLPIIAQTAFAMADEKEKIINAGCDDYISKPIDRKKLLNVISKYLNKTEPKN